MGLGDVIRKSLLTLAFIEKYKDKLDWLYLSANPSLNPALIEKYIDKLDGIQLSRNPALTPSLIEKYKDKWNWKLLSYIPAIFLFEQGIVNHSGGV